jgi:hypothetical protein
MREYKTLEKILRRFLWLSDSEIKSLRNLSKKIGLVLYHEKLVRYGK